jgi:hypothetical protein
MSTTLVSSARRMVTTSSKIRALVGRPLPGVA